jgi:hypothetical protein
MRVQFSEVALAGIRREFPDSSRQQSCIASLRFYLRRDHEKHSIVCPAFHDINMYLYAFGNRWRVLYSVDATSVVVWSFSPRRTRRDTK